MVRLVLFDIDGTLVRTGGAGMKAFDQAAATAFGLASATAGMSFAGRTDTSLVRELLTRHRIAPEEDGFRRFFDTYLDRLRELLPQHAGCPCPGVREFIAALAALPEPPLLGLQTGNIRPGAELKLRHYELWDCFALGGFGDDSEQRNELTAIARDRGSRRLGRDLVNGEVLVVGDTPADIACGRSIGARVLAVATGGAALETLRSHDPDWAVADLREMSAREACR